MLDLTDFLELLIIIGHEVSQSLNTVDLTNGIQTLADFIAYDNKQFKEVRKVKHSVENEDGTVTETYGPETEESIRTISGADARWPVDPLAEVDPAFVSLTEVV